VERDVKRLHEDVHELLERGSSSAHCRRTCCRRTRLRSGQDR
jgi:hypothetical protein